MKTKILALNLVEQEHWVNFSSQVTVSSEYLLDNYKKLMPVVEKILYRNRDLKGKVSLGNLMLFDIHEYIKAMEYASEIFHRDDIKDWKELEWIIVNFQEIVNKHNNREFDENPYCMAGCRREDMIYFFRDLLSVDLVAEPDIVKVASLFKARFVKLQPFHNGNHRTGSFIMNMILAKMGWPIFIVTPDNVYDYYKYTNTPDLQNERININSMTAFFRREINKNYKHLDLWCD